MRLKQAFKRVMRGGSEIGFSILLVLCFFTIFLGLLAVAFPEGTSVRELMSASTLGSGPRVRAPRQVDITEHLDAGDGEVALLSRVHRKVKDKGAQQPAWRDSREGISLRNRHSVQTLEGSAATITFANGTQMVMGERSLVVLRSYTHRPDRRTSRAAVVVMDGELEGRIPGAGSGDSSRVDVLTAGASRLRSAGSEGVGASFRVSVDEAGSSTFSVFEGHAEISAGGETVIVKENEGVTVEAEGVPPVPLPLASPPVLSSPDDGETFFYRNQPPRIRFAWVAAERSNGYRISIARDAAMSDLIYEGQVEATELVHGNLGSGTYYWRVRSVRDGFQGASSGIRSIRLERDSVAPALHVQFPPGPISADRLRLRGTTEVGAKILVDGAEALVHENGAFERDVPLRRGVNVIVVEAIDGAGNTTYRSGRVHAKY